CGTTAASVTSVVLEAAPIATGAPATNGVHLAGSCNLNVTDTDIRHCNGSGILVAALLPTATLSFTSGTSRGTLAANARGALVQRGVLQLGGATVAQSQSLGVLVAPSGGDARLVMTNGSVNGNTGGGVRLDPSSTTGAPSLSLTGTDVSQNGA